MAGKPRDPGNARRTREPPTLAEQARAAVAAVTHRAVSVRVRIPRVGEVRLPPVQDVVFLATVGALTAFGLIEWPVALVVVLGHTLAAMGRAGTTRAVGEGLQQA